MAVVVSVGGSDVRFLGQVKMAGIFINYRRDDSAPYAGRLYDRLIRDFPDDHVFMDIDAIDPGEDFVEVINQKLVSCDVVVALIGDTWASCVDSTGARRLDNPDDFVRRELAAALARKVRIIPVLVGGAEMPRSEALPAELAPLCRRNALEVSDTRFHSDVDRLRAAIRKAITNAARGQSPVPTPSTAIPATKQKAQESTQTTGAIPAVMPQQVAVPAQGAQPGTQTSAEAARVKTARAQRPSSGVKKMVIGAVLAAAIVVIFVATRGRDQGSLDYSEPYSPGQDAAVTDTGTSTTLTPVPTEESTGATVGSDPTATDGAGDTAPSLAPDTSVLTESATKESLVDTMPESAQTTDTVAPMTSVGAEWSPYSVLEEHLGVLGKQNVPGTPLSPDNPNASGAAQATPATPEELHRKGTESYQAADYATAAEWYRMAAEQGFAPAQADLAYLYLKGLGVAEDYSEAVNWYRKAAEQRYAPAQAYLGYLYDAGQGVERNYVEAASWYRKAAEQGSAYAQFNLGLMYERGDGVEKDDSEAASWYRKAAAQGDRDAQTKLTERGLSW